MKKLSILFPGQGAQFIGMGKLFYDKYQVCRDTYQEASENFGHDIVGLCFNSSMSELWDFTNMQVAIVTTSVAIYRAYLKEVGVIPEFMAGHSVGEVTALICSGALKLPDAIDILKLRGKIVKKINNEKRGRMTIVGSISKNNLEKIMSEYPNEVYIACYNSKNQFAISGNDGAMDDIEEKILDSDSEISPMFSSPPMHSKFMEPVKEELLQYLNSKPYLDFEVPVVSNVSGRVIYNSKDIPNELANQLVSPVKWSDTLEYMNYYGTNVFLEMGPKLLLTNLVEGSITFDAPGDVKSYCYGIEKDRKLVNTEFQDNSYQKDKINFFGNSLGILASSPNIDCNEAYLCIKEQFKLIKKDSELYNQTKSEEKVKLIIDAFKHLLLALQYKKLSSFEYNSIIHGLLYQTNMEYIIKNQVGEVL